MNPPGTGVHGPPAVSGQSAKGPARSSMAAARGLSRACPGLPVLGAFSVMAESGARFVMASHADSACDPPCRVGRARSQATASCYAGWLRSAGLLDHPAAQHRDCPDGVRLKLVGRGRSNGRGAAGASRRRRSRAAGRPEVGSRQLERPANHMSVTMFPDQAVCPRDPNSHATRQSRCAATGVLPILVPR